MWWPGLSKQLEDLVTNCAECCKNRSQNAEPLIPTSFPKLPLQKVASDLFVNSHYLLINYFLRYIKIAKLHSESAACVIKHMKSVFARHGIPQEVVLTMGFNNHHMNSLSLLKSMGLYIVLVVPSPMKRLRGGCKQ